MYRPLHMKRRTNKMFGEKFWKPIVDFEKNLFMQNPFKVEVTF